MKKIITLFIAIVSVLLLAGCFNEKNSPFYNSEWIMQNADVQQQLYYHQLILEPAHKVTLRTSYYDSTNIIVWTGTYKIDSKKINFNFEECTRFEEGKEIGKYDDKRLIKFYNGEFLYSLGMIGDDENKVLHMQLIRPKNQIYGETKDLYGNYFEDFIKMEN